ncbi:MAG: molecular chaperone TorD family protein [Acidobacteria bacterium]|nr:molecular chaperone TorD family protein [Acidobacteriota bacterium]
MTAVELLRALSIFAEPPEPEHARVADLLGLGDGIDGSAYAELFVFQLAPYASIYVGPEGWMGGEARERIAGFWRAVGRTPSAEPDHLGVLLSLYASLGEEQGRAAGAGASLASEARGALLHEHIAPWVFAYLDHVEELAVGGYKRWAELLRETLAQEVGRVGPAAALPAHLREAPELADPRAEGGSVFLKALFAPVRSGVILTRAALGKVARELGLGLRAGERRFALEGLLGQDARATLGALAALAAREELAHRRRDGLLGETARFLARRAGNTARLLGELATESTGGMPAKNTGASTVR